MRLYVFMFLLKKVANLTVVYSSFDMSICPCVSPKSMNFLCVVFSGRCSRSTSASLVHMNYIVPGTLCDRIPLYQCWVNVKKDKYVQPLKIPTPSKTTLNPSHWIQMCHYYLYLSQKRTGSRRLNNTLKQQRHDAYCTGSKMCHDYK